MPSEESENNKHVPIWYDLKDKIYFDKSTVKTHIIQLPPVTTNTDSGLNTTGQEIRFEYAPSPTQWIHLASDISGLRCRFYYLLGNANVNAGTTISYQSTVNSNPSVTGIWNNTSGLQTGGGNNLINPLADIAPESSFWGMLFNRATLVVSGNQIEDILYFQYYFHLMCHLQTLDFKLKHGNQIGYIPDEITAAADSSVTPYITLGYIGNAALAVGASGQFNIVVTNYTATAIAAGAYNYQVPGTNIVIAVIVPAGGIAAATQTIANGVVSGALTYTSVGCQVAAPFAVAANTTATWSYTGGIFTLQNTTAAAIAAGAAIPIIMSNTTSTTLAALVAGSTYGGTINSPLPYGYNPTYEPGYLKRKQLYNINPVMRNGIIQADPTFREIEVFIPLHVIFGYCRDYDRVTSQVSFQIKLLRDTSLNYVFGQTGFDGALILKSCMLELQEVIPNDELRVKLNREIESPIEVGFLGVKALQFQIPSAQINQYLPQFFRSDFMFIIFKDATINQSSQTNSTLLTHANMQSLQILLDGELYPYLPQMEDFGSNKFSNFYERFKEVCIAMTGECNMSSKEYRDLYPIFAFDLRAQSGKIKNQVVPMTILGTRNSNTPSTVNMYVYGFMEQFYKAEYIKNLISPIS
jgi:hypothetical protein